jgi:hypothetical protein
MNEIFPIIDGTTCLNEILKPTHDPRERVCILVNMFVCLFVLYAFVNCFAYFDNIWRESRRNGGLRHTKSHKIFSNGNKIFFTISWGNIRRSLFRLPSYFAFNRRVKSTRYSIRLSNAVLFFLIFNIRQRQFLKFRKVDYLHCIVLSSFFTVLLLCISTVKIAILIGQCIMFPNFMCALSLGNVG